MNFWQWLVTPQGIPVLVALVGILSGVIGGGVSQVIAGYFKTRGDTRQINAAAEVAKAAELRWEREQEFERRKLIHASLREACSLYLREANSYRMRSYDVHYADPKEVDIEALQKEQESALDKLALYQVDVQLLAPQLWPAMNTLQLKFINLRMAEEAGDRASWSERIDPADTLLNELTKAMHACVTDGDSSSVDLAALIPDNRSQLAKPTQLEKPSP